MEWAVAMGLRTDNPCNRLAPVLGPQQDLVQHMRALPHAEVAAAVKTARASAAAPVVKLAFEFPVLTAVRSGDVRGAVWTEIDLADRVWTIPALRMNAKREHRVPLCERAVEILGAAWTLGGAGSGPRAFRHASLVVPLYLNGNLLDCRGPRRTGLSRIPREPATPKNPHSPQPEPCPASCGSVG